MRAGAAARTGRCRGRPGSARPWPLTWSAGLSPGALGRLGHGPFTRRSSMATQPWFLAGSVVSSRGEVLSAARLLRPELGDLADGAAQPVVFLGGGGAGAGGGGPAGGGGGWGGPAEKTERSTPHPPPPPRGGGGGGGGGPQKETNRGAWAGGGPPSAGGTNPPIQAWHLSPTASIADLDGLARKRTTGQNVEGVPGRDAQVPPVCRPGRAGGVSAARSGRAGQPATAGPRGPR